MTLSHDIRQRVLDAYRNKEGSQRVIAERFKISRSTLQDWLKETPETPFLETRGRPSILSEQDFEQLRQLVVLHPDATYSELAQLLAQPGQEPCKRSVIYRALTRLNLTRKKRLGGPASKDAKTSKKQERNG
jgi:transposase